MRAPVTAVVFDVDDTLYLERDYVRSGFDAVDHWLESARGVTGFGAECWAHFEAGARGHIFDATLASFGLGPDDTLVEDLVAHYRSHDPEIALMPDALAVLDHLEERVAVAVITDGPSQEAKVRRLGLRDRADPVILTTELGSGFSKPHPRAYEIVEQTLRRDPEECAYIGDNPTKDFAAPHRRGWTTVRVRRSGGLHHGRPSGNDVDYELDDLVALPTLLGIEGAIRS